MLSDETKSISGYGVLIDQGEDLACLYVGCLLLIHWVLRQVVNDLPIGRSVETIRLVNAFQFADSTEVCL